MTRAHTTFALSSSSSMFLSMCATKSVKEMDWSVNSHSGPYGARP